MNRPVIRDRLTGLSVPTIPAFETQEDGTVMERYVLEVPKGYEDTKIDFKPPVMVKYPVPKRNWKRKRR